VFGSVLHTLLLGLVMERVFGVTVCPDAGQPLRLGSPIMVGGHTWCHISSVNYYVWVRQPGDGPIDLDNTEEGHMAHGVSPSQFHKYSCINMQTLFHEIRMGDVEAMLGMGLSFIKHSIVNYFDDLNIPLDPATTNAILGSQTPLPIQWKNFRGGLIAAMRVTAHQRYHWWLEHVIFRGQKHPYDTDSPTDSNVDAPSPPSSDPQQLLSEMPEDAGVEAIHSQTQSDLLGSPVCAGDRTLSQPMESIGRVLWMTKRRAIGK